MGGENNGRGMKVFCEVAEFGGDGGVMRPDTGYGTGGGLDSADIDADVSRSMAWEKF